MSDSVNPLDPAEVAGAVSALAEHLQRSGVAFVPQPDPAAVQAWQSRLADVETPALAEDETQQVVAPPPPGTPPPGPAPPGPAPPDPAAEKSANRPPSIKPARRSDPVAAFASTEGPYPGTPLPIAERQSRLDDLAADVAACTACTVLASCRTKTVFGEGNVSPRFTFFGEGPGADEDRTGRPFVGKAGQLLTKMISACKFDRSDAYILNTVKCRPPANRNPEPDEIQNCRPFYEQQLAILRPEYIVCLGAISAQELLKTKLSVGRLRGKLHTYFDSKVLVTYHPAYLLRNPAAKKAAWDDLQLMMRDAGLL